VQQQKAVRAALATSRCTQHPTQQAATIDLLSMLLIEATAHIHQLQPFVSFASYVCLCDNHKVVAVHFRLHDCHTGKLGQLVVHERPYAAGPDLVEGCERSACVQEGVAMRWRW